MPKYRPALFAFYVLAFLACSGKSTDPQAPESAASDTLAIPGLSSQGNGSSQALSSSSAPPDISDPGSPAIILRAAHNPNLFQDIVFELQGDSSYLARVAHGVQLNHVVPSFAFTGSVEYGGNSVVSGVTAMDFSDGITIVFDGGSVIFNIARYFTIPTLYLETVNGDSVLTNTEYIPCALRIDGKNLFADYAAAEVRIRQRGNSSRIFYPKNPYRIKLGVKAGLLGMQEDKDWVLLANYRDPTHMMNAVAFDMARYMGLPFTNSNRFVEVHLNGDYIGMYQLTEQVEQGVSRVAIDENTGVLLSLDLDDGPELAPAAQDNFYSVIYELPVCVKHPKDPTAAQLEVIRTDFAELENLIQTGSYSALAFRLDIASFIDFLILQEWTRNVELVSPRSMYMYKDADNIYHFGPVWDFDGGFAFDWASMTEGHNYFGSQSWLMGASNPSTYPRTAYNRIPGFFVDLFANAEFVAAYQARWRAVSAGALNYVFAQLDIYTQSAANALAANALRWPIGKDPQVEIQRLKDWLGARASAYSAVVDSY